MMGSGGMGRGSGYMWKTGARGPGYGMMAADANKDGAVSREEAVKMGPRFQQRFDASDANKDGKLSTDEMNAACPYR